MIFFLAYCLGSIITGSLFGYIGGRIGFFNGRYNHSSANLDSIMVSCIGTLIWPITWLLAPIYFALQVGKRHKG